MARDLFDRYQRFYAMRYRTPGRHKVSLREADLRMEVFRLRIQKMLSPEEARDVALDRVMVENLGPRPILTSSLNPHRNFIRRSWKRRPQEYVPARIIEGLR